MKLYEKHNYLNKNIEHIKSGYIIEYDMKNAGLEILYANNIFNEKEYNILMSLDKLNRSITIGKFLKNHQDINDFLINQFIEVRKELFELNDINDYSVLSIKKDAVFLIDTKLKYTTLEKNYKFIKKNEYSNYLYLMNKEHYYNVYEDKLDLKGYNKLCIVHQENYIFKELKKIMQLDYYNRKDDMFLLLINLKEDFLNRNLEKEYYYDLILNKYLFSICNRNFSLDFINDDLKKYVLYNNNLKFITEVINRVL